MIAGSLEVRGVDLDRQARCVHYNSAIDIIAIKMKCCGVYYACKDCHEALAGHEIQVWPKNEWVEKAVVCGRCRIELTIADYMANEHRCPVCGAGFNPGCEKHYHFYFDSPAGISKSLALR